MMPGPAANGGFERFERVERIRLEPVEKMLGIVNDPAASGAQVGHRLLDDAQVVLQRGEQHVGDVQGPGFAEEGAHRRPGIEQRLDIGVVLRTALDPAGGAKGGDQRGFPLQIAGALEKLGILGIGAGPAAFDKSHAQIVQSPGHADFVVTRQGEPFALGPVAQGGVVNLNE